MLQPVDMITSKGHPVFFDDPKKTYIDIEDLRISTRNICRYNGGLEWHLVKHLALCVLNVETVYEEERWPLDSRDIRIQKGFAAAHDLHEIYVGDMVNGLKKHLPHYKTIEHSWECYVHRSLGLAWEERNHYVIKRVDCRALAMEMTYLGHPAAEYVRETLEVILTPLDKTTFELIATLSRSECWNIVHTALFDARNALTENR
jgi:hypothetical protein